MSVTSLLNDPKIRELIDAITPTYEKIIPVPMRIRPRTQYPALMGTAFDYALRFELARRHKQATNRRWIAEEALDVLPSLMAPPHVSRLAASIVKNAGAVVNEYTTGGKVPRRDAHKAALQLAKLDPIFRAGRIDYDLERVDESDIVELGQLVDAFPYATIRDGAKLQLNPTFGEASILVGGADADLIIDSTLVDLKVTTTDKIERDHVRQLISYAILAHANAVSNSPKLSDAALYFARHAYLWKLPLAAIYEHPQYERISNAYFGRASEILRGPSRPPEAPAKRSIPASALGPALKNPATGLAPEPAVQRAPARPTTRPGEFTPYHAKYYAHELTKLAPGGDLTRISQSLFDACVDLNPHQIEAGLFALRSPLSKGVILADEVGLGKTIEAGLVICQYWAERSRRILIICPASIRKQWQLELSQKFNLPSTVLDSKGYKELQKKGYTNPFEQEKILVVSYPFASRLREDIEKVPWNLVVIDEAHRLRNPNTKASQNLRESLRGVGKKLLLTATPLQNNLAELHTLTTFIDEHAFGDRAVFQARYGYLNPLGDDEPHAELRERLKPFVKRTLRKDVLEYISYTKRQPITVTFDPTAPENQLYERVSEFLQREDTYAIPHRQRHLITLILRKILASSTTALATTLTRMRDRLLGLQGGPTQTADEIEALIEDEAIDEEEIEEDEEDGEKETVIVTDPARLNAEIAELNEFIALASTIQVDSKSSALLRGLREGFARMDALGAARKALVFTESRRTQQYLKLYLEANGYAGAVAIFNGTNTEPECKAVYAKWLEKNEPLGRASGNKSIDMRTALVEHFRDEGTILLATEAAGEGVNLQFCSLVINYDLPWNPQRIEQRIGRCHRYGQKFDVVVVNFLNPKNQADARVLELLTEKFHLFQGVFGSSDEVLGTVESGVDFEKKILTIYQNCRDPHDIKRAFDQLQREMESSIKSRMADVRQKLLDHFDEEVHNRFRNFLADTQRHLGDVERMFWYTTKYVLAGRAKFIDAELKFNLTDPPTKDIPAGRYKLIDRTDEGRLRTDESDILYRLSHPLGELVLDTAKDLKLLPATLTFDISRHPTRISVVESLRGKAGWLQATKVKINTFTTEEFVLLTGIDDSGLAVEPETLGKLWTVRAVSSEAPLPDAVRGERLSGDVQAHVDATVNAAVERNEHYFSEQQDLLQRWADDLMLSAQKELDEGGLRIQEAARLARHATNLPAKMEALKKQQSAERALQAAQRRVWQAQDEIRARRDGFIQEIQAKLHHETQVEPLFRVRWVVA